MHAGRYDDVQSRWAKYEIARSVIDGKGLLAVHLNSINHNQLRAPDPLGINPLHVLGIYRSATGSYFLAEKRPVVTNATTGELGFEWLLYDDYKDPLSSLPKYIPALGLNTVVPLSRYTREYDMMAGGGYQKLWSWIEAAAKEAGR